MHLKTKSLITRKTQKTIDDAIELLRENNYKVIDSKGNQVN